MICPRCAADNPAAAKFCFNCGNAFGQRCANCQSELPAGARFCMNCGQPVGAATPADDARLTRLSAATPAPLAHKMRAAHLAGERKVVTILFADVVGSTALAEHMDPEDWTAIMNRAFDLYSPIVYRYEGTIARLMGDALLVFFGAPVAHEDDPSRAVRAALDMVATTREYAERVRAEHGIEFAVRAGINTGQVVVGDVGSDLKYEYTAMGDGINLAARLQSAARPMTVLISEHSQRFVAPVFDCSDLGVIEVKGRTEPVRVFEVRGLKAAPGRVRGLAGLESPMVGREGELATLLQLSAAVGSGLGRAVAVVGEPGLGKSRLIAEWHQAMGASLAPLQWAEGHCLSYGQGLAYHLLIDLVRSLIGVTAAAGEAEVRAALQAYIRERSGGAVLRQAQGAPANPMGVGDPYPYLAHLLSVPLEGAAQERIKMLDPQALQAQYLIALRDLLQGLAGRQPLALVLDDIHWADPSSTDLLIKLLPLTAECPLLFCFITRPDRDAPGWRLVTAARDSLGASLTELNLHPLSEADSNRLVSNLLEIESLPENVRSIILRKAEGNPFFVEELIRMLIDHGAIVRKGEAWVAEKEIETVDIPDNLQGLLLARIDRLPEDVKRTLRVASVIGRQFSVKVLEKVLAMQ
ncbi:MAG: AAA family ATPase [Chloroflexi bacterium]|nr:AAA family ATPase [Chloroflexota bacterium]